MIVEKKSLPTKMAYHGVAIITALCCLAPTILVLAYSFFPNGSLNVMLGTGFTTKQFSEILLLTPEYFGWFWNSFGTTICILAINVPISLMAGYAFSQYHLPWLKWVFMLYIVLMLMPFQATLVPQYITLNTLNLLNSHWAIILPNAFGTFGAFLMSQSMSSIPKEVIEAGKIDGLREFSIFTRIIIPLSYATITALMILVFIDSWSMVEQPTIFLKSTELFPLSISLTKQRLPTTVFAGSVVFSILPFLIYLRGYDRLVDGISLGSMK